jgi:molybdopterin-guanine dinucleotide biosynthesis protein A
MKPFGLIVAGGKSERFGSPKILHVIDGIPQWERLANAMSAFCDKIILNIPTNLRSKFPEKTPFEFLLEDTQNGPLEGLCKAFVTFPNRDWLVVGSDHFWVESETFQVFDRPHSTFFTDDSDEIVPWLGKIMAEDIGQILDLKNIGENSFQRILKVLSIQKLQPSKMEWITDANSFEKIPLLHPTKSSINLDVFKYVILKYYLLRTLQRNGPSTLDELKKIAELELKSNMSRSNLWYLSHVLLDLEVRGMIGWNSKTKPKKIEFLSLGKVKR